MSETTALYIVAILLLVLVLILSWAIKSKNKPNPDVKERLMTEHQELEEKYNKLKWFIKSKKVNHLPREQRDLLFKQEATMSNYLDILEDRIILLNSKN